MQCHPFNRILQHLRTTLSNAYFSIAYRPFNLLIQHISDIYFRQFSTCFPSIFRYLFPLGFVPFCPILLLPFSLVCTSISALFRRRFEPFSDIDCSTWLLPVRLSLAYYQFECQLQPFFAVHSVDYFSISTHSVICCSTFLSTISARMS